MLHSLKQASLKAHLWPKNYGIQRSICKAECRGCRHTRSPEGSWEVGTPTRSCFGGWVPSVQRPPPSTAPRTPRRQSRRQLAALWHHLAASTSSQAWRFPLSSCCCSPQGTMWVFMHNQCSDRMLQSLEEHVTCRQTYIHTLSCVFITEQNISIAVNTITCRARKTILYAMD